VDYDDEDDLVTLPQAEFDAALEDVREAAYRKGVESGREEVRRLLAFGAALNGDGPKFVKALGVLGKSFDESKHPRDGGKFAEKPGAGAGSEKTDRKGGDDAEPAPAKGAAPKLSEREEQWSELESHEGGQPASYHADHEDYTADLGFSAPDEIVDRFRDDFKSMLREKDDYAKKAAGYAGAGEEFTTAYQEARGDLVEAGEIYKDALAELADAHAEAEPVRAELNELKRAPLEVDFDGKPVKKPTDPAKLPKWEKVMEEYRAGKAAAVEKAKEARRGELDELRAKYEPLRERYQAADRAATEAHKGVRKANKKIVALVKPLHADEDSVKKALAAPDPVPDDDDDPDDTDTYTPDGDERHDLLAVALQHAQDSLADGSDPQPVLDALYALGDDPERLERVLSGEETFEKALQWQEHLHPRGRNGRFIGRDRIEAAKHDPELKKELRKEVKPGDRKKLEDALSGKSDIGKTAKTAAKHAAEEKRSKIKADRDEGRAIRKRLSDQAIKGKLEADDLHALIPHLSTMTGKELSNLRELLQNQGVNFGGKRTVGERRERLEAWAKAKALEARMDEQGFSEDEKASGLESVGAKEKPEAAVEEEFDPDTADVFGSEKPRTLSGGDVVHSLRSVAKELGITPEEAKAEFDAGRLKGYRVPGFDTVNVPSEMLDAYRAKYPLKASSATPPPDPLDGATIDRTERLPLPGPAQNPAPVPDRERTLEEMEGGPKPAGQERSRKKRDSLSPAEGDRFAGVPVTDKPAGAIRSEVAALERGKHPADMNPDELRNRLAELNRALSSRAVVEAAQEPRGAYDPERRSQVPASADRLAAHSEHVAKVSAAREERDDIASRVAHADRLARSGKPADATGGITVHEQTLDKYLGNADPNKALGKKRIESHRAAVEAALAAGKPVPPKVLADYPDLAPKTASQVADEITAKRRTRGARSGADDAKPTADEFAAASAPAAPQTAPKDPLKDADHLNQLAKDAPTPAAKDALEAAAHNLPGTKGRDYTPEERRTATRERLASAWAEIHDADPAGAAHVAGVMQQFGGETRHAVGDVVPFDGRYHESDGGAFTGDMVRVTRPAVVAAGDTGTGTAALRAKVTPNSAPTGLDSRIATGNNTPTPPTTGGNSTGGASVEAKIPSGHKKAGDVAGGAVVSEDSAGQLTTHFAPGESERQAKRLAPALARALQEAQLYQESQAGLMPLSLVAAIVKRNAPKGTSNSDILAALAHVTGRDGGDSFKFGIEGHNLNETWALNPGDSKGADIRRKVALEGSTGRHDATHWKNGRALGYLGFPYDDRGGAKAIAKVRALADE